MALNDLDRQHFSAMTRIAFTPGPGGLPPAWLQAQFDKCVSHYQELEITPEFRSALHRFQSQQEEPFEVFVVGEGNFGKSTLVNALVGQKISAVDFRPETRSFLRYVLNSTPAATATIYARLQSGVHDQMKDRLGDGEPCEEIYGALRYTMARDEADELLAMDSSACRELGRNYTPAILEIERQLHWDASSLFPEGVRLVDTQGLNQIFDDDLLERCADMESFDSEKEFDKWMSASPRGRHLDWQFRRCDAVLWLISAQKPSSGATRAALRYLSKYGKRTIIAVTQVDRVHGGKGQLDRVLAEIRTHFGEFGSEVLPINGKLAMESSVANDKNEEGIRSSGLAHLVTRLRAVCLEDAGRVRALSQYVSLKTTEAQMRTAIGAMIADVEAVRERLAELRRQMEAKRKKETANVRNVVGGVGYDELRGLKSKVDSIGLMDDTASALAILQPDVARRNFENSARSSCILLRERLKDVSTVLKAQLFSLPSFDAEGRRDKTVVSAKFDAAMGNIEIPGFSLSFELKERPIKALKIWAMKKLPFTRKEAEEEESRLNGERRGEILAELDRRWSSFEEGTIAAITGQIDTIFTGIRADLDRIEREIEAVHNRPLEKTAGDLEQTLSITCVQSPFLLTIVTAMQGAVRRAGTTQTVRAAG